MGVLSLILLCVACTFVGSVILFFYGLTNCIKDYKRKNNKEEKENL